MKRTTQLTVLTFALTFMSATSAKACCLPYIPWLDPFAWLGFYGCGGGYGGTCGAGCGYGYQQPVYGGYQQPIYGGYAPQAPVMSYPAGPAPGCNCTGALPQQQTMAAVQVPVTTYRAVTQYVPQTTYQTQYQYQPAATVAAVPTYSGTYPTAALPVGAYPSTAFHQGMPTASQAYYDGSIGTTMPSTVYPSAPMMSPGIQYSPGIMHPQPLGDVAGDHEYPSQSAVFPAQPPQYQYRSVNPIRPASYGVTPQPARTFSATVR
jgi:hypothetical protein